MKYGKFAAVSGEWITASIWALILIIPLLAFGEWKLSQFTTLLCYGIFAISLGFVWDQVGLLCFGQALFFGMGAYIYALGSGYWEFNGWSALLLGMIAGACGAAVLGAALFFGRILKGAFFGIVTLCAAVIAELIAINTDYIGGYNGILDVAPLPLWGELDTLDPIVGFVVIVAVAIIVVCVAGYIKMSPWGTILRAVSVDEERVATFGYPVGYHKVVAFAFSGGIAALAGGLFAGQFGFVSPNVLGFGLSTEVLVWVLVGGRKSLTAAFLGALLIKYLESVLSSTLGVYWLLALGVLLIIIVTYFPRGVLGGLLGGALPRRLRHR